MNIEHIRDILRAKGIALHQYEEEEIAPLRDFFRPWAMASEFISHCIPERDVRVSGLILMGPYGMHAFNIRDDCTRRISQFGFLHFAGTTGGNSFVIDLLDESVCFVDHCYFSCADEIEYVDKETQELGWFHEYTRENVRYALIKIFDSVEAFYDQVVAQDFEEHIDTLDGGGFREYFQGLGRSFRES